MASSTLDRPCVKIVFLGSPNVGKSSIWLCYHYQNSLEYRRTVLKQPDAPATIGVDFTHRQLQIGANQVLLMLYDTSGQERFACITHSYIRSADGVIVVYDVTDRGSFTQATETIPAQLKDVLVHVQGYEPLVLLLGNKSDASSAQRQVQRSEGEAKAAQLQWKFLEVSALKDERPILERINTFTAECFANRIVQKQATTTDNAVSVTAASAAATTTTAISNASAYRTQLAQRGFGSYGAVRLSGEFQRRTKQQQQTDQTDDEASASSSSSSSSGVDFASGQHRAYVVRSSCCS